MSLDVEVDEWKQQLPYKITTCTNPGDEKKKKMHTLYIHIYIYKCIKDESNFMY